VVPYANTSIKSNGHASAHQFYNKTVTNGVYCNSHAVRNPREAKSPVKHKKNSKERRDAPGGSYVTPRPPRRGSPVISPGPQPPERISKSKRPTGRFRTRRGPRRPMRSIRRPRPAGARRWEGNAPIRCPRPRSHYKGSPFLGLSPVPLPRPTLSHTSASRAPSPGRPSSLP
jgi:hypothetical protein